MIARVLIFIILTFPFISISQEVNKKDSQGRKQGMWIQNYEGTENKKYVGKFKDDKPTGLFKFFYETGEVFRKVNYESEKDAFCVMYHKNGKIMAYGNYTNQEKDSTWNYFDADGNLVGKEEFKNGVRHGKSITFYQFNPEKDVGSPRVLELTYYKEGLAHGEWKKYYRTGSVMAEGEYVLGGFDGAVTYYRPSGIKESVHNYKHGVKSGFTFFYDEDGEVSSKKFYLKGTLIDDEKQLKLILDGRKKKREQEIKKIKESNEN